MEKRDFTDMIIFFCQKVSEMNISRKCKMELLGMITAIEMEHDKLMPKWIPVTERLPEDERIVLCTVEGYKKERWVFTDCRYKNGIWEILDEPSFDYWTELDDVIAWMPLPEPWRGE